MNTLDKIVSAEEVFGEAALRVFGDQSTVADESQAIAAVSVIAVIDGRTEVSELRKELVRANSLSHEAVGFIGEADDATMVELLARRIFHGSARRAVNWVKTERRLNRMVAKHAEFGRLAEKQILEENKEALRIYQAESLVQYMMKEGK
jgi:hypothetical protein